MNDPRLQLDFIPEFYPNCDYGSPPIPFDDSPEGARKIAFLAAYYQINRCHRALLNGRKGGWGDAEERAALQAIESALLARDALEDQYAAFGVIATPEFANGFVTNVSFLMASPREKISSISMLFSVPPLNHPTL